ncbi:hypothetical protein BX616_002621, partial [Lobosporangium transversale]
MTELQFQKFRKTEEVCVKTASTGASNDSSLCYVSLQDIRDVFPDAQRFKLDGDLIPFLLDADGNKIEPPRIAFYPDKVLDVITEVPQSSNSNKSLTVHNNKDFSSYSDEIKEWMVKIENKGDMILTLQGKMDKVQVEMHIMQLEMRKMQLELKEKTDEVIKLQLEAKKKDDKLLEMQQQALDRLVILQQKAEAILAQTFELHEYPIPRLFIVLPIDRTKWDPMNVLRNKVRLHFLCECGDHDAVKAIKNRQNQVHLARHEGYEIRDSTEFFRKYGNYMVILLQCLKIGMPLATSLGPAPSLKASIDYSLDYMKALSVEYPVLSNINTIEDCEALEGADLRGLNKFLQINDEDGKLGNLYRIRTEAGHIKWVCLDHHRSPFKEKEQEAFVKTVEMNGGKYDSHLGKVVIKLHSITAADEFFSALTNAKHIYELDITFEWDWSKTYLEALENALRISSVSILRLDLGSSQESITRKLLLTNTKYEKIIRIIELKNIKAIHIILPPDLVKLSSLPNKKSRHHHELFFEMRPREIGASDFRLLVNSLKSNATLTTLDLRDNSIGNEGALVLSEALKANATLTSLGLRCNLIGDEGAYALSEALKANTTLAIMDLRGNAITKEGALVLLDALKTSSTLKTLGLRESLITGELSEALKGNTVSTTLDVRCRSIGNEMALALSEALKINRTLTALDLGRNSIGNEGTLAISEALKVNATLAILGLSYNSIGKEGALTLSEVLKVNTTLTTLDLERNSIRNEGALALSEALKTNTTLSNLNLSWNSIGDEGELEL